MLLLPRIICHQNLYSCADAGLNSVQRIPAGLLLLFLTISVWAVSLSGTLRIQPQ